MAPMRNYAGQRNGRSPAKFSKWSYIFSNEVGHHLLPGLHGASDLKRADGGARRQCCFRDRFTARVHVWNEELISEMHNIC
jgi:hypothetical protein